MRAVYTWVLAAAALAGQDPGAKGVNFYSMAAEREEGRKACEVPAVNDPALQQRAAGILAGLAARVDPPWPFEIRIYDDGAAADAPPGLRMPADAFSGKAAEPVSCAGGPILLPRSMAQATDTQLREQIAHAMAHIALRHASRLATQARLSQMAGRPLADAGPTMANAGAAMDEARRRALEARARGFEQQANQWAAELLSKE